MIVYEADKRQFLNHIDFDDIEDVITQDNLVVHNFYMGVSWLRRPCVTRR